MKLEWELRVIIFLYLKKIIYILAVLDISVKMMVKTVLRENLKFLSEFKGKKINLVGVHIRDHQLIPYLEAFQKNDWNMVSINFLNEVAIIEYQK